MPETKITIGEPDKRISKVARPVEFKKAMAKLATDAKYRAEATKDPKLIVSDFKLSYSELDALRTVAILSGADVRNVEKIRGTELLSVAYADIKSWSISCCSCCCCCCGETAVAH